MTAELEASARVVVVDDDRLIETKVLDRCRHLLNGKLADLSRVPVVRLQLFVFQCLTFIAF